jgi:3-oxoacyl-(acyl-carrier-protein) synthase III
MNNSRILSVSTYFPENFLTIDEVEGRILRESSVKLPVKTVKRLTGVEKVFYRSEGEQVSDLAVAAAKKTMYATNISLKNVDLLIFASASQDLIEPATAHIVAQKLGLTCPVFDVKNACNSFLNGIQVADAFIKNGTYKTVLIVTGETPSVSVRWACDTKEQFVEAFPGYSMSDSGGAMLLQCSPFKRGVVSIDMSANSNLWEVGILDTGGSRNPRNPETTYFNIDGHGLYDAFHTVGCDILFQKIRSQELDWGSFTKVGVHQVSTIYTKQFVESLGIPESKLVSTVEKYGNVASNSLPLQLSLSLENGDVQPGDRFAFVGLGGGISTGLGVFQL